MPGSISSTPAWLNTCIGRGSCRYLYFNLPVVKLSVPKKLPHLLFGLAHFLPCLVPVPIRLRVGARRNEQVNQLVLGKFSCSCVNGDGLLFGDHVDCYFREIPYHRLNIPPHVTDLGEFRCLDLYEGRLGELCQPAGYFGFTHPRGSHHQYVLGRDLVSEFRGDLLSSPPVSKGHADGSFGHVLPDYVLIKFRYYFPRGEVGFAEHLFYFLGTIYKATHMWSASHQFHGSQGLC